jgi:ABC-type antimicrobial peptide transport system permease subunit
LLAYAVTQRTNEIGLRMALGAQREQVVALILCGGLRLVAVGLVLGLVAAIGASRLIRTLLFSVQPLDPLIYVGVTFLFTLIAVLACLIPARRATQVDPIQALRAE